MSLRYQIMWWEHLRYERGLLASISWIVIYERRTTRVYVGRFLKYVMVLERGGIRRTNSLMLDTPIPVCPICGREHFAWCCEYAQKRVRGGRFGQFQKSIQWAVAEIVNPITWSWRNDRGNVYEVCKKGKYQVNIRSVDYDHKSWGEKEA